MATTMKLIAKQTLGSAASSVTFSSIPATTYDDLVLFVSARTTRVLTIDGLYYRFNGDTNTANYSTRRIYGTGSSFGSDTNRDGVIFATGSTATASTFGNSETYIPNAFGSTAKSYSSTITNENNDALAYVGATAALWTGTSAISSIAIYAETGANIATGSSFYLFGVSNA